MLSLTLSGHALVGYSSHFVVCLSVSMSVCLSVSLSVADLEEDRLLALQRDVNLNWTTVYIPLICIFLLFGLVLEKK